MNNHSLLYEKYKILISKCILLIVLLLGFCPFLLFSQESSDIFPYNLTILDITQKENGETIAILADTTGSDGILLKVFKKQENQIFVIQDSLKTNYRNITIGSQKSLDDFICYSWSNNEIIIFDIHCALNGKLAFLITDRIKYDSMYIYGNSLFYFRNNKMFKLVDRKEVLFKVGPQYESDPRESEFYFDSVHCEVIHFNKDQQIYPSKVRVNKINNTCSDSKIRVYNNLQLEIISKSAGQFVSFCANRTQVKHFSHKDRTSIPYFGNQCTLIPENGIDKMSFVNLNNGRYSSSNEMFLYLEDKFLKDGGNSLGTKLVIQANKSTLITCNTLGQIMVIVNNHIAVSDQFHGCIRSFKILGEDSMGLTFAAISGLAVTNLYYDKILKEVKVVEYYYLGVGVQFLVDNDTLKVSKYPIKMTWIYSDKYHKLQLSVDSTKIDAVDNLNSRKMEIIKIGMERKAVFFSTNDKKSEALAIHRTPRKLIYLRLAKNGICSMDSCTIRRSDRLLNFNNSMLILVSRTGQKRVIYTVDSSDIIPLDNTFPKTFIRSSLYKPIWNSNALEALPDLAISREVQYLKAYTNVVYLVYAQQYYQWYIE